MLMVFESYYALGGGGVQCAILGSERENFAKKLPTVLMLKTSAS